MGLYVASWNTFLHYVGLVVVDTSFTVMASMYLNVAYILESYGCRTLMVTTIVLRYSLIALFSSMYIYLRAYSQERKEERFLAFGLYFLRRY